MKAVIEVDMDGAAFDETDGGMGELARVLRQWAADLDARVYTATDGQRGERLVAYDYNGNRVGWLRITGE